ncbi:MAG: HNH endonuclease [SAR324 cluster bacterium]|nr:HNH endonuclease [SAR324 cluster bacterium]
MSFKKTGPSKGRKQDAAIVKKAFGEKCALCGIRENRDQSKSKLMIHHIDCQRENNTKENLIVLCRRCHNLMDQEASYYFSYKGKQLEMFPETEDYLEIMENLRLSGLQRDFFENDTDFVSEPRPLVSDSPLPAYQLPLTADELPFESSLSPSNQYF